LAGKKQIVFTVSNDVRYDRRMQRICTSLANSGYDVTLIGRRLKDSPELPEFNFKVRRVSLWFASGKLFYLEMNLVYFFLLLFSSYDIYSAVDIDTGMAVWLAAKIKGKATVLDAHEYFPEVPEVERRPLVQAMWRRVDKFLIPRFDLVYTVSYSIAQIYSDQFKRPVEVIRNMPNTVKADIPGWEERKPWILYQGAVNEGRGLEQAIMAMMLLEGKLLIAGEGDISDLLKENVVSLGLGDKVEFLGWVEPENLADLTLRCRVGLNLLEARSKSYFYSLANKAFDYIQAGLPAIHMNFPEYQALNQDCEVSLLCDDLKADSLSEQIDSLLNDRNEWERLHSYCLKAKKTLNWENESKRLLKLYDELD
jgi:glycosyltransferase involved in cell wall biosynthesis